MNPDKQDGYGQVPLLSATKYEHGKVLEMVIKRDDINLTSQISMIEHAAPISCREWVHNYGGSAA